MTKIERSIIINAPWEAVDEIATDPSTHPQWFEGIEEAEGDGQYPLVGGQVRYKYRAAGASFNLTGTVTSYEKGSHLTVKMDGMITGVQHWEYVQGDGSTTINASFDYEVPGGGLGKIADKLIIERVNASNLEKSLENLKQMAEG